MSLEETVDNILHILIQDKGFDTLEALAANAFKIQINSPEFLELKHVLFSRKLVEKKVEHDSLTIIKITELGRRVFYNGGLNTILEKERNEEAQKQKKEQLELEQLQLNIEASRFQIEQAKRNAKDYKTNKLILFINFLFGILNITLALIQLFK